MDLGKISHVTFCPFCLYGVSQFLLILVPQDACRACEYLNLCAKISLSEHNNILMNIQHKHMLSVWPSLMID